MGLYYSVNDVFQVNFNSESTVEPDILNLGAHVNEWV